MAIVPNPVRCECEHCKSWGRINRNHIVTKPRILADAIKDLRDAVDAVPEATIAFSSSTAVLVETARNLLELAGAT
jgi:hypothetical protein